LNQTNIARTNNIIKSIASEFGPQYEVVGAIGPMNESVTDLLLFLRDLCLTLTMIDLLDMMDQLCLMPCANTGWIHTGISEKSQQTRWK
jgi:hypothetical protein